MISIFSSQIQNKIIKIVGEFIQEQIVNKIKQSGGLYLIVADETQDVSTNEQMSLCLRYESEGHIYEAFVSFIDIFESNSDINIGDLEGEIIYPKISGKVLGKTKSLGLKTVWDKDMRCCVHGMPD